MTNKHSGASEGGGLPGGWIKHDGGSCPVDAFSKPGVIIRGFGRWHLCQMPSGPEADEAQCFDWRHGIPPACEIIAYHPETNHE